MKKIYVSMIALVTSMGAVAQSLPTHQSYLSKTNNPVVASEQSTPSYSVAASGDTINGLYYDFSTPSNWVIGNEIGATYDWVIGTGVPSGDFPIDGIESTTAANGFALYDSDLFCATDNHYIQLADPVDLTGFGSVELKFQQYYRQFQGETFVDVSTDGGTTWTAYQLNAGVATNDATVNPDFVRVNISGAVAANPSTVWIRFRYVGGCDYAWMVDDVAFVEGVGDDIAIDKVYYGDVINDWEYAITPVEQTVPVYLGVFVTNNGGNVATNVVCNYDITLDGNSVNSGSFVIGDGTLELAATDTGWYDTGYTPSTVGVYTVTYTVSSDATDALPDDNEATAVFETSEYEWSHEREELWDGQYGGYVVSATDQTLIEYSQGSVFYPVVSADLYAIKVSFGASTSASASTPLALTVEVHEIGANIQDIVDSEIQAVDISENGWQTFVLDDPLPLNAGTGYILSVTTPGGEDVMVLDGWGVDDDFATANYGPFGTGGAVNWYNGWGFSSAIRAVFDPTVGVEENEDVSGVNIFPNPASDDLTVNFVSKEDQDLTVNVINSTGALIASEQVTTKAGQNSRLNFNVQELAAGIYMVQIQGLTSTLTKRVVVQ